MNKIQLLKEPGYIYDLNFIFCLKFNKQLYIDPLLSNEEKEEAIEYFNDISTQFGNIPDDLYVFFHAIETGRAFLPSCYFNPYKNQFSSTFNFKFLLNELSDSNKLIRNLIRFYFYELDDQAVEECAVSLNKIFLRIKESEYSEKEKNKLYEFFIDPHFHILMLQQQLIEKEFLLSQYYKDNYQKIIDLYNQTTYELLCEQLKNFKELNLDSEAFYLSFCLLNSFCVYLHSTEETFFLMLGRQYYSILKSTRISNKKRLLNNLGTALAEESRIKILNFLLSYGEITCKKLEKEFNFSGSTAYHHITILTKTGLVKTRNEGKTVLYSLNREYFDDIIRDLLKYSNLKKGVRI